MKIVEELPTWVRPALQGVAFWMGHRNCFYRHHPLTEGALVAEVCNLLYANLDKDFVLQCEVQYSSLLGTTAPNTDLLKEKARADLVVAELPDHDAPDGELPTPKFIIEVKRGSSPLRQVKMDLARLAEVCRVNPGVRGLLFLISEARRPNDFVTAAGASILGIHEIKTHPGFYRVRRTYKAAHAFNSIEKAQYACVIEAFSEKNRYVRKR